MARPTIAAYLAPDEPLGRCPACPLDDENAESFSIIVGGSIWNFEKTRPPTHKNIEEFTTAAYRQGIIDERTRVRTLLGL